LDLAGATVLIIRRLIMPLTVAVVTAPRQSRPGARRVSGAAARSGCAEQRFAISAGEWRSSHRFGRGRSQFIPAQGAAPITGSAFERGPGSSLAGRSLGRLHEGIHTLAGGRGEARQADQGRQLTGMPPRTRPCKLIGNFGQAEIKMIKYVETHAAKCGIPPQISSS
jgi:hypothetical protein